ncbi:MAG: GNAT family N-acetyltransferase [Anaerolineae bacterium]|nr:GNAT family N-acetyltransferase [Anaerolineae bacterium]
MNNQPSIRLAVASDWPAIRACIRQSFDIYVSRIGREPAPMRTDYRDAIAAGDVFVVDGPNNDINCVLIIVPESDHLLIDTIAVAPALQHQGIGRVLMAHAEQRAAALGFNELRLYTNVKMTENQRWYPRLGYRETHREFENGYERVFYSKHI